MDDFINNLFKAEPDWPRIINRIKKTLNIPNSKLAIKLGISKESVDRWFQSRIEPKGNFAYKLILVDIALHPEEYE